ncbi:MAG TPA: antibiotic biosynthesis monooxygenase family protein [Propionibacteriaceae bacterium]|nr:antibiotic biosynthesis monooxygenase family protein [Propionibacteriaceae bacterium]
MLVVTRFQVPEDRRDAFTVQADAAVGVLSSREGLASIDLVQNLDDPDLWCLVTRWADVGSYRRALSGFESKMTVVPLLSLAIDEPSAYDDPADVGPNIPRDLGR